LYGFKYIIFIKNYFLSKGIDNEAEYGGCNPSYLGGRDGEGHSFRPVQGKKVSKTPSQSTSQEWRFMSVIPAMQAA
jgi:hypothetical protein